MSWRLVHWGLGRSDQSGGCEEGHYNCHECPLISPGDVEPHAHQYRCCCAHQQSRRVSDLSDRADVPSPEVSCLGVFGQWDCTGEPETIEEETYHEQHLQIQ